MSKKIIELESFHFVGIAGIGMSGVATIVLERGQRSVSGSDLKSGHIVEELKKRGAQISEGHKKEHVPPSATIVVSTDIPVDNPELIEAKRRGLPIIHRSDLLRDLMQGYQVLAVTGTHGKTTTTSLLSHVLMCANQDPTFVVGGILVNYGLQARHGKGNYFVAEADESDATFLKYPYSAAIVTNIDSDHLAHHGSMDKLEEAFSTFVHKAPSPKAVFFCGDDARLKKLCPNGTSYGFHADSQVHIEKYAAFEGGMKFDLFYRGKTFRDIELNLHGRHNVLNASAVFGLALTLGIDESAIREAFRTFKGVKRRLEKKEAGKQHLVFDDYGHHPTEIRSTLEALRPSIGDRRLIAVFQPHRPSRMKYCIRELPGTFREADVVVTTDLYLSNEPDSKDISTDQIFETIRSSHSDIPCYCFHRHELVDRIFDIVCPNDVIVFFGAGDSTRASDDLAKACSKGKIHGSA